MDYLEAAINWRHRRPHHSKPMPLPRTTLPRRRPITTYIFRRHSLHFTTHKWRPLLLPLLSVNSDPHNWKVISIQPHRFTIRMGESRTYIT